MKRYEYKILPAPTKGQKAPGVKGPEARFSHALQSLMNGLGAEGWEYQRADILPSEERQGLTSSHTVYRTLLVFRRELDADPAVTDDAPTRPTPKRNDPPLSKAKGDAAPRPAADIASEDAAAQAAPAAPRHSLFESGARDATDKTDPTTAKPD